MIEKTLNELEEMDKLNRELAETGQENWFLLDRPHTCERAPYEYEDAPYCGKGHSTKKANNVPSCAHTKKRKAERRQTRKTKRH